LMPGLVLIEKSYGRGGGVGRDLGVTFGRAVGVAMAVGVGVAVGVALGVIVDVAVAVAVGVAVAVAVATGVTVAVGVTVGVGEGVPIQTVFFCTVATLKLPLNPPAAMSRLSPIAPLDGKERATAKLGAVAQVSVPGS
jgi:hypothetical protein